MAEFESWKQYHDFAFYVMRKARHVLDEKNERFLEAVLDTSTKRTGKIAAGTPLWRAAHDLSWREEPVLDGNNQRIDSFDVEAPAPPERMMPYRDRAIEGRVNPKGIPCLYLCTNRETAMTEVRPWIGSYVSVAQFLLVRDVVVVDCTQDGPDHRIYFGQEPPPEKREQAVWSSINEAFSRPVTRSDDVAEYAPTQLLAEAFRSIGRDGLIYGSKLGSGKNIAIFDLSAARQSNCFLYRVERVDLKFEEVANPYFLPDAGPAKEREQQSSDSMGAHQPASEEHT